MFLEAVTAADCSCGGNPAFVYFVQISSPLFLNIVFVPALVGLSGDSDVPVAGSLSILNVGVRGLAVIE